MHYFALDLARLSSTVYDKVTKKFLEFNMHYMQSLDTIPANIATYRTNARKVFPQEFLSDTVMLRFSNPAMQKVFIGPFIRALIGRG